MSRDTGAEVLAARFRELAILQRRIVKDQARITRLETQAATLQDSLTREVAARKLAEDRLARFQRSTFWRLTAPLRRLTGLIRRR